MLGGVGRVIREDGPYPIYPACCVARPRFNIVSGWESFAVVGNQPGSRSGDYKLAEPASRDPIARLNGHVVRMEESTAIIAR